MQKKYERGITLIALVVTVIVIMIIAGVSISSLSGQDNAITSGNDVRTKANVAEEKSTLKLSIQETQNADNKGKIEENNLERYLNQHIGEDLYNITRRPESDSYVVELVKTGSQYTITSEGELLDGVVELPTIVLNLENATLAWNQTLQLTATLNDVIVTDGVWKSSDTSIAKVDSNGLVVAQEKSGVATISIEKDGITRTCEIIVNNPVTRVALSQTDIVIDKSIEQVVQVTGTYEPANADYGTTLTYTIADESIAVVDETGNITGISNGTTTLTLTSGNGVTATANIKVQTSPTGVVLNKDSVILDLSTGEKTTNLVARITPDSANIYTDLKWTSSNTSIATVDQSGKITGVQRGTAVVTVQTGNGKKATCNVTVNASISSISLNMTETTLHNTGETVTVKATTNPESTSDNIIWTSSDTSIAKVSSSGENGKTCTITAQSKNGTVTITAKSAKNDSIKATMKVNVALTYTITYNANGGTCGTTSEKKIDEKAVEKISINDKKRILRILEIYHATGKNKTEQEIISRQNEIKFDYKVFALNMDREKLYERINKRVDIMIEKGLIEEVNQLLQKYTEFPTAMQGLGYKEVREYLQGNCSKEEMIDKIKQESRRYAKRQLTWFRKNKQTIWLDGLSDINENIKIIKEKSDIK